MKISEWLSGVVDAVCDLNWMDGLNKGIEMGERLTLMTISRQKPLTVQDVADQFPEVTEREVRHDCETGELPAWKHGPVWAVWKRNADFYVAIKGDKERQKPAGGFIPKAHGSKGVPGDRYTLLPVS